MTYSVLMTTDHNSLAAASHSAKHLVAPLSSFGSDATDRVGGKAANLGELIRAGLPVPKGFAITTTAYTIAAEITGIPSLLSNPNIEPANLREVLRSVDIPQSIREQITAAYHFLGDDVPVAVRSSATAEDLPGAAFAGQQDTYLNIIGSEALLDAVRNCWASLWTDRAVTYRREQGIDSREVSIAVVVQEMVDAETAGVMFTADPVTGARDRIVVDAGAGLGEAVVSGLVTPDHYVLDRDGHTLDWTPGLGEVVVRSRSGGGVRHENRAETGPSSTLAGSSSTLAGSSSTPPGPSNPLASSSSTPASPSSTPANSPTTPADSSSTASAPNGTNDDGAALLTSDNLAELAAHARTIAEHFGRPQDIEWAFADGRIWITQARPMTALPPDTGELTRTQRLQAFILTEVLPVRPYPMDMSTQTGRGPIQMMNDITRFFGVRGAFEDVLREEEGVVVELKPKSIRPTPRVLLTPAKLVRRAHRFDPARWEQDPRQQGFLRERAALESLDLRSLDWSELLRVPERALATMDICSELRIDYLPGSILSIIRATVLTTVLGRQDLLADLLGGAPTRTEESNRALANLARMMRENAAPADFNTALADFLQTYGRRETTSPLLVSTPTLAEEPAIFLNMVRSLAEASEDETPSHTSRSAEALRKLLTHPLLRGRRSRARVARWMRAAQYGVAFREDTHFYFTGALPTLRRSILEIGGRLGEVGLLDEVDDVFHLRLEEVAGISDPTNMPVKQAAELRARIRQRAAKRSELAGVPLIDVSQVFRHAPSGDALVSGTPACAGTVTGTARIVRGAADFEKLGAGEILVCPYTNPAWTPLFARAGGVVVDTGSIASHAAIVAREYGIPAIMGTGVGTRAITDGERITVDGGRGQVTRASSDEESAHARRN